ncbi:MAG: hypothetical protein EA339_07525 [Rhodobacteraceae bacterium]|nr:MAG: hypothetical protein EA339_07525 [Paracoccaceae bacterium]
MPVPVTTILLLTLSNVFMTSAWHGHLKFKPAPRRAAARPALGACFFRQNRSGS